MKKLCVMGWALVWTFAASASCGGSTPAMIDASSVDDEGEREDLSFSSDVRLTGYLSTHASSPPGSPGVVLVHQYQRSDEQWGDWPAALAAQGYRVLAFNLRGHGDSDPYDGSLAGILSDPDAAPSDLRAALAYLSSEGRADPERIAVIGTSVGANLAVGAAIAGEAKTYVSLSSRRSAVEALAGTEATGMASVFYLASSEDGGGVQAADATSMHELTAVPRQVEIYPESSDHGIALLDDQEGARDLVEAWLEQTL